MKLISSSHPSLNLSHPTPDRLIWNTLIKLSSAAAPLLFLRMRRHGVGPDLYTFPFLLHSLSSPQNLSLGKTLHALILSSGFFSCNFAQNSLLDMYSLCGDLEDVKRLFSEISSPDLPTRNTFLKAHLRFGAILEARNLFDKMPQRNVISWSCMIDGLVKVGEDKRALDLFKEMLECGGGTAPNEFTMSAALAACSKIGALEEGKWVHSLIEKSQIPIDTVLGTCLIDMYVKCGSIERAYKMFDEMPRRDVLTWSAMIGGLALHGRTNHCFTLFGKMIVLGVAPNDVTVVGILSACAHSGRIYMGEVVFSRMSSNFGVLPSIRHYGCLIDLYARAGFVRKAMCMVDSMPMEPDLLVWGALLSGSRIHGVADVCEISLMKIISIDPMNGAAYVMLANLYTKLMRWEEARRVREVMEEREIRKTPGGSLVEIEGIIQEFGADVGGHVRRDDDEIENHWLAGIG